MWLIYIMDISLNKISDVLESESELTKTIQSASLDVLLRVIITGKLQNLSIPIDKTAETILLELLDTTPKVFDNIQESVKLIVQDGKINSADIPHLYSAIAELYPLVKNSKIRPSSIDCAKIVGTIVKVVIHVLVNEHKIKVEDTSKFLQDINKLVDSAIELISLLKIAKQKSQTCFQSIMRNIKL